MKCSVALGINNGDFSSEVEKYGAKVIATSAVPIVNNRNLNTVTHPSVASIKKASLLSQGASYIFSNVGEVTTNGMASLGLFDADNNDTLDNLVAGGANLYKDIAANFFERKKGKILSPTPYNDTQIIVEKSPLDKGRSDSRTFLNISSYDTLSAKSLVDIEFLGEDEADSPVSKNDLYKEGMEFLLISALYRGYDISVSGTIDAEIVKSAISRYNILTGGSKKVMFASTHRSGPGITKVHSINGAIARVDTKRKPATAVDTSSDFLSAAFTKDERRVFDVHKEPSLSARLIVANKVIGVFKDMVPNLDTSVLSTAEIKDIYGPAFANKKGFIIGGKIVINQEKFSIDTLFHEFGHYYSRWVEAKPEVFTALMETIKSNFGEDIETYNALYQSTGLVFSEQDILEEIFVDKLGLEAARDLDAILDRIDPNDSTAIGAAVEDFTADFLKKMTRNPNAKVSDTSFTLNSSIGDMFNIAMKHSSALNPTAFYGSEFDYTQGLREFFINKPTAKELFIGLESRGLIRGVGENTIALHDDQGNRVDIHGNQSDTATYKFYPWDSVENIRKNKKFLKEAEAYLDQNKNFANVRFADSSRRDDTVRIINSHREGVEHNDAGDAYVKNGVEAGRVTAFLQEEFSAPFDAEKSILTTMFKTAQQNYIAKARKDGREDEQLIEEEAFDHAREYMKNKTGDYFYQHSILESKYEFKTYEGTYLHTIAEFYFRALNYSQKIKYSGAQVEDRGLMYYAKGIKDALSSHSIDHFVEYVEKNFIHHLGGEESTNDYKDFMKSFEFLQGAMKDTARSQAAALKFVQLLEDKVVPVINNVKGPYTIMPEVRLHSANMKLAGTIDLIVIDGDGRAHIFDYKTKESGRHAFWNWKQGTNMKGVMGAYKENAMMKASIQTSIYKLFLMEMGIQTAGASVFYVSNSMNGLTEREFAERDALRYSPEDIKKEGLLDVSAELMEHLIANQRAPKIDKNISISSAINRLINQAAGGVDIDQVRNVERTAIGIYERAMKIDTGSAKDRVNNAVIQQMIANMGVSHNGKAAVRKGLEVTLPGNIKRALEPGLDRDESIAAIIKMIETKEATRTLQGQLFELFYAQDRTSTIPVSTSSSRDRENALRSLIKGTDASSHELIKLSSDADYGIEYSSTQLIKNKITGDVRMIIINDDEKTTIKYGGPERNNIFGKYLTNNGLRIKVATEEWENNNYNMRLIKAGLIMVEQKKKDPNFTVSMVIANPGLSKNSSIPRLHDVAVILNMTKKMLEVMRDAGEDVDPRLLESLKTPELFESRSYLKNPVESLAMYLETTAGDFSRLEDMFKTKGGKQTKKRLNELLKNYDPNRDVHKLRDALSDFRNTMEKSLVTMDSRKNNDLWTLTDNILLFLNGHNYNINPKDSNFISNNLFTTSKMSNSYAAAFNRKINESRADISTDFMAYKNEHNKLIQALAKAKGVNIGKMGEALFNSSMKKIYKDLYTTDNTDRRTAYILKDPSQVSTQAEKDYLIYLRGIYQKFGEMSSFKKVEVPFGWMPLTKRSQLSKDSDRSALQAARDSIKLYDFNKRMKDVAEKNTMDEDFAVTSRYAAQLPNGDSDGSRQFSYARRSQLSLDETLSETGSASNNPLDSIEDNLENATDAFVLAALDSFHYKDVAEFGRAMYYTISRHEDLSQDSLSHLTEVLHITLKRVVLHQESDADNNALASVNKFATTAVIAGSVAQALLETFSNPLVTSANYLGDKLYGVLFNGVREFDLASYRKAIAMVSNPLAKEKHLIEAISNTYGITNSDTDAIKKMMNQLEQHSLFQSENLMYVNKLMLESWQKITMVAYMLKQGTFYAHSLDKAGNLVYDEKKDERFHFSHKGDSKERIYKEKVYDAVKEQMAKQRNGLNGTDLMEYDKRTLKKCWTTFDANHVKELIVEAYSSLDDTSKSSAMYYTYMKSIIKMRSWLFSKMSRYFQKPMTAEENESASRLVRVEYPNDPNVPNGYRMEWKGQDTEGILYTVWSLAKQGYEYRTDFLKKKNLTENQKKNLSKLYGDLLIFTIMGAAASGLFKYALDDEDRQDELTQLVYKRWMMATSDTFVLKSILDMTAGNGSIMVGVSVFNKALQSALHTAYVAPMVLIDEDTTIQDLYSASGVLAKSVYGPAKTFSVAYNEFAIDN